jgi:hypothetical protein
VISQGLLRREEPPAVIADELADLPMLCDLVSEPIVPSRKALGAAERARERYAGLRLVCVHVDLQRVLAREPAVAFRLQTAEAAALVVVLVAVVAG